MKKEMFLFILLAFFLSINIVLAQPPFPQSVGEGGLNIQYPKYEYVEQNVEFDLHTHVINNTQIMTDAETSCLVHIYNISGQHLAEEFLEMDSNGLEFKKTIDKGNFSLLGIHAYIIQCNTSAQTGMVSGAFEITKNGRNLETSESILYIILTLAVFFFFITCLYASIVIPYANKKNERGETIQVIRTKYIKMCFIILSYALFIWFLNILIGLSDNYVNLSMFYGLISFLFLVLSSIAYIFFIVIFVWALFELIRDANIQKKINKLGRAI